LSEKFMSFITSIAKSNCSTSFFICPFHFIQNQQVFIVFSYSFVNVQLTSVFKVSRISSAPLTSLPESFASHSLDSLCPPSSSELFYSTTSFFFVNIFVSFS